MTKRHNIHIRKRKLQASRIQAYRDFDTVLSRHRAGNQNEKQYGLARTIVIVCILLAFVIFGLNHLENNNDKYKRQIKRIELDQNPKAPKQQINKNTSFLGKNTMIQKKNENINAQNSLLTAPSFQSRIANYNDHSDSTKWVTVQYIKRTAKPQGGYSVFYKTYIQKQLKYPEEARKNKIAGTVYVQFVVHENGTISDAEIMSGIGFGCNDEALRLIKNSPIWHPAEYKLGKTKQTITIPIRFNYQNK